jgi:two-component system, OmpR family, sensor histidine kinase BaeS
LKFTIGNRLLAALLLSFLGIGAVSLELIRWKVLDNFPGTASARETPQLANRKGWLQETLAAANAMHGESTAGSPASATLGYRIGLLDADRRFLAGSLARKFIVAFASIDRVETPLLVDGNLAGFLVCATPQNPDDALAIAFLIDQQDNILVIGVVSALLSVVVAMLLSATFRRPIRRLVAGAQRLEQGHFEARLNSRRSDELGQLSRTFDRLAARLDETERHRRQWVADTSHELRTPLSILSGQIEALQDGVRTSTPDNLALLGRQVRSLTQLVDDLYELARGDIGQLQLTNADTNIWRLVEDEAESFSQKIRAAELVLIMGRAPECSTVTCDADRIRQILRNVLENCVRYTAAGGRIEINGFVVDNELRIVVDDSAPGVPASALHRIGERFFRVEHSRNRQFGGSGLGLALSRQIAEAHEGRLEFGASPLGGLRAILLLPLTG